MKTMIKKILPKAIKNPLNRFLSKNSLMLSQAGQDYWVFGEAFNEKKNGYFLDIGAHDGLNISNTYLLESRYNWTGLCIEANPITFAELKKNRRAKCLNVCLDDSEGEVNFALRDVMGGIVDSSLDNTEKDISVNKIIKLKTVPLINVLKEQNAPSIIDYLTIDVEGAEERILGTFNFKEYIFRCITIERPTEHLRDIFKSHGYLLVKEIPGLDCFYVHQDFLKEYKSNLFQFYAKKHLAIRWR